MFQDHEFWFKHPCSSMRLCAWYDIWLVNPVLRMASLLDNDVYTLMQTYPFLELRNNTLGCRLNFKVWLCVCFCSLNML